MSARRGNARQSLSCPGARETGNPQIADDGGGGSWRLPSGQSLAEFALRTGLIAQRLLGTGAFRLAKARPEKR